MGRGNWKSVKKTKVLVDSNMMMVALKTHLKMKIICDVFGVFFLTQRWHLEGQETQVYVIVRDVIHFTIGIDLVKSTQTLSEEQGE